MGSQGENTLQASGLPLGQRGLGPEHGGFSRTAESKSQILGLE